MYSVNVITGLTEALMHDHAARRWAGLGYSESTWERAEDLADDQVLPIRLQALHCASAAAKHLC